VGIKSIHNIKIKNKVINHNIKLSIDKDTPEEILELEMKKTPPVLKKIMDEILAIPSIYPYQSAEYIRIPIVYKLDFSSKQDIMNIQLGKNMEEYLKNRGWDTITIREHREHIHTNIEKKIKIWGSSYKEGHRFARGHITIKIQDTDKIIKFYVDLDKIKNDKKRDFLYLKPVNCNILPKRKDDDIKNYEDLWNILVEGSISPVSINDKGSYTMGYNLHKHEKNLEIKYSLREAETVETFFNKIKEKVSPDTKLKWRMDKTTYNKSISQENLSGTLDDISPLLDFIKEKATSKSNYPYSGYYIYLDINQEKMIDRVIDNIPPDKKQEINVLKKKLHPLLISEKINEPVWLIRGYTFYNKED